MAKKRIEADEPQDTEGNGHVWSDAEIKHDVTPLVDPKPEAEDTEGQALKFGRTPGVDGSEDTEGNVYKVGH